MATKKSREVRTPGAASTAPSDDAAIAAGRSGGTHKVSKHPDPETLPKSTVKGDPSRGKAATVNSKVEMKYDDAMELMRQGKLTRSVLTERGWLAVKRSAPAGPQ